MPLAVLPHPEPIAQASARERLSVTTASQDPAGICPLSLSQEASRERAFPPVASAVIGTLVHAIIEDATRRGAAAIGDVAAALAERCASWDEDETGGRKWPHLVPLRRYLVDERRRDALATIAAGIAHLGSPAPAPAGNGQRSGGWLRFDGGIPGRWPERRIEDEELGLVGCIDLLTCDGRGRMTVIDYKTGFDQESEDQQDKRAVYHRQVQIYLHMLSRKVPGAVLDGRLMGSHGEDAVPWDAAAGRATGEHIARFRQAIGASRAATSVPSESACRFCPIRHRCRAYRPWVESTRASAGPGFLAGNAWGVVKTPPRIVGEQASMSLLDGAGTTIVINGLVPRDGYRSLVPGTPVSIYGFKPECDPEGNIRANRLWERRPTGRSLCASALLLAGHPVP